MSVSIKTTENTKEAAKGNQLGNMEGILEACIEIASAAKPLTPFDLGLLRGSITYKTYRKTGAVESPASSVNELPQEPKPNEGYVGTNVQYAIYQEFGTRNMKARPFLRPAALIVKKPSLVKEIIEAFNSEMAKELPKAK